MDVDTYRWVLVCKGVVNAHVLKVLFEISLEEILYHLKTEIRIDEYCPDICL